tara:strand:+ start:820 stop:984 length:165 start_codon:yes stop_codon:yes gene_type:complete
VRLPLWFLRKEKARQMERWGKDFKEREGKKGEMGKESNRIENGAGKKVAKAPLR